MKQFRIALALVSVIVFSAIAAFAQTPAGPTNGLAVAQEAADLAEATAFKYRIYVDGVGGVVAATCSGTVSPFTCRLALPAMTPGAHTLTATAARVTGSVEAESVRSATLAIVVIVAPSAPSGLRIVP